VFGRRSTNLPNRGRAVSTTEIVESTTMVVRQQQHGKTVSELEDELKNVKSAFEEYIESSKELEEGLDRELSEMRK
jgi:hypothetical protein